MIKSKLYILGIGPGDNDFVCPAIEKIIEKSDVIIGGRRNLQNYTHLDKEILTIGNNLDEICSFIEKNIKNKVISVLASGDPGIFSIMEYMKNRLKDYEMEVFPGISSFQYLCAKLKLSWHDMLIVSLHGREHEDLLSVLRSNEKVMLITGGASTPQGICRMLLENGLKELRVTVGENLSYPKERIVSGKPEDIVGYDFESLSLMLIENNKKVAEFNDIWSYSTEGIPDNLFIRGEVPMTKEEVRAVTLSKLRLKEGHIVYDIGAGTGSVSIECGLKCRNGKVISVEKEEAAVELIKKNIQKFGLTNIQVIAGIAPDVLNGLPSPDRVFIGGTGKEIEGILTWISGFNNKIRVVANAIAIESVYEIIRGFEEKGFTDIEITNISVAKGRSAGGKHLMQALNPIYIISGEYGGEECQVNYME